MLPVSAFQSFISENHLFDATDRILLAVSGGKDSVLMAHLFNAAGVDFGIGHCNFQLRGEESEHDEDFTEELAKRFGVPFFSTRFDTKDDAQSKQISIQMAARDLRYNWLEEIRKDFGFTYIALAHHQNDTVETVLLNLVRGTGLAGLHGILPKRNLLIRPLLFLDREKIEMVVRAESIFYREDSSNLSTKYARNKIRHEVIPVLKSLNPQLERTFEDNSRRFATLEDFLKQHTDALREQLFSLRLSGDYQIDLDKLKKLAASQVILFELFKPFGFAENILSDLTHSWDGQSGKIFISGTHKLTLDRSQLFLTVLNAPNLSEVLFSQNDVSVLWNEIKIIANSHSPENISIEANPKKAFLDAALLIYPLTIRSWKEGDYFYPFGMKGKKKLSDFFISAKIPLNFKKAIPLLINGDGNIIWIAGYRHDDRYKVTSLTKKVTIFELQK